MQLAEIYRPIEKELNDVEQALKEILRGSRHKSILEMSDYLLDAGGKRLRPALALLSAKASHQSTSRGHHLVDIACAIELIHIASLIHDDVIDGSRLRHNKPTINFKWGEDVSIALGDYLYSVAFELISQCGNTDILQCISSATKAMCEGELLQVCERDNLNLSKEQYILVVKKKTAALFAASCQVGASVSNSREPLRSALKGYGLNFGTAFQIVDDYLDLVGEEEKLGKKPGQDIKTGEVTLPMLNLWESLPEEEGKVLKTLLFLRKDKEALPRMRKKLFDSGAAVETRQVVVSFVNSAKDEIDILSYSPYKESLLNLADFVVERMET